MNKEIKEIAKIVVKELDKSTDRTFYTEEIATALHKAGYRKQSDTVKEFAEKVKELDGHIEECCMQSFCDMLDILAEQYGKED